MANDTVSRPNIKGWLGAALLVAGILLVTLFVVAESRVFAARRNAGSGTTIASIPETSTPAVGDLAAGESSDVIRIPGLALAAPITDGVGPIELIRGVGHIPGTARAGGLGTVGLAGHRDTFFRALRDIRPGTAVFLTSPDGTFRYEVDGTKVVDPSRVDVLSVQQKPTLILVTCFPFGFIGAAPKRFIVSAHLTSLLPSP